MPLSCGHCGSKMETANIRGELFPYKTHRNLPLNIDLNALKCVGCGEIVLKGSQIEEIDAALLADLRAKGLEV